MVETNRRQLLKAIGAAGIVTSLAGCNGTETGAEITRTQTRSRTVQTSKPTTTTATETDVETTTGTEPETTTRSVNEEFQNVQQKAEEVVDNIQKAADEGLSESTIYMGNVNSYPFSVTSLYSMDVSEAESVLGKRVSEDLERSDKMKLIRGAIDDRINENIEHEYMSEDPQSDSIEPKLLLDRQLDIDVIPLERSGIDIEMLKIELGESLGQVLSSDYDVDISVKEVDVGSSPGEAFVRTQKRYAQNTPGTLQLYLTQKPLGEMSGLSLKGYAPIDGNTAVVHSKVNELFGYDEMDVIESAVHEIGHSAFDIQHSASQDDVMMYTDEADVLRFGRRSKHLIRRYLNSELEITRTGNNGSGTLIMGFKPSEIDDEEAESEFLDHLERYFRDVEGFEDIENWKLEYSGQTSMGSDKAIATRQFDTGETLQMDIRIRYYIDSISLRAMS